MSDIVSQLSSQLKVNSNEPNKAVAKMCVDNPLLLEEIAGQFTSNDKRLIGDCIEVFTEVGIIFPDIIVKYALNLVPLLKFKEMRIRWEAMHSLALIASQAPDVILSILPELEEIILHDASVVVRDYATDAVSKFAGTSPEAANIAYIVLKVNLDTWGERHAARVIEGLINVYDMLPVYKNELLEIASKYRESTKGVLRKAVGKLEKRLGN